MDKAISKYVPTKTLNKRNKPNWMTKNVEKLISSKGKKYKKAKKTQITADWSEYKKDLNKCTAEIKKAKLDYEQKLAENIKINPKAFYLYANNSKKYKDK